MPSHQERVRRNNEPTADGNRLNAMGTFTKTRLQAAHRDIAAALVQTFGVADDLAAIIVKEFAQSR